VVPDDRAHLADCGRRDWLGSLPLAGISPLGGSDPGYQDAEPARCPNGRRALSAGRTRAKVPLLAGRGELETDIVQQESMYSLLFACFNEDILLFRVGNLGRSDCLPSSYLTSRDEDGMWRTGPARQQRPGSSRLAGARKDGLIIQARSVTGGPSRPGSEKQR